jgi:type IX secretion system PorP/SprF family membrane protein
MSCLNHHNFKAVSMCLVLFFACTLAKAQTSGTYTQYMDNLTPVNAAYSLLDKGGSVNTVVRKQFTGIQGAPTSVLFNADIPVEPINGTLGLIVKNDDFAIENATTVSAFFGKAINLNEKNFLSVALSGGFRRYVANYSSLDPSDPQFRDDIRETTANLGFGVMLYSDNYYVGLSVPELSITQLGNASIQNAANFKNTYYLTGAYLANAGEDVKIKPATMIAYAKGEPAKVNVSGTVYLQEVLGVGANYLYSTQNKQFAGMVSFNFNTIRLGYSYQFSANTSNIGGINNAVHEVTLNYRFGKGILSPKLL